MRNAYKKKMLSLCEHNKKIILLLVDSGDKEYDELRMHFSDRIVECGIAEQNAIGVAAGLASEGLLPIIYGMAPFLIYRGLEFIRDDICLQNLNVKIIGSGAGIIYNNLGPTHHATEDMGIMRTLPGMTIVSSGSPFEVPAVLDFAIEHVGPVYVRMGKAWEEEIYDTTPTEAVDHACLLKSGNDICIFATGSILATVIKVAQLLEEKGISAAVYNLRVIKPVKEEQIAEILRKYKKVITIEEHNVVNGLGSMLADLLVKYSVRTSLYKIGFIDRFCTDYGWYQDIKKINGLGELEIFEKCMEFWKDESL